PRIRREARGRADFDHDAARVVRPHSAASPHSLPHPMFTWASSLRTARLRRALVSRDDLLHEAMAHHVALGELDEPDALDAAQDLARLDQTRSLACRQIDLRDVAGDHGLRTEAEARQEHLHLLAGRILRLVEDDEGVVQGPAPHEGEWCD